MLNGLAALSENPALLKTMVVEREQHDLIGTLGIVLFRLNKGRQDAEAVVGILYGIVKHTDAWNCRWDLRIMRTLYAGLLHLLENNDTANVLSTAAVLRYFSEYKECMTSITNNDLYRVLLIETMLKLVQTNPNNTRVSAVTILAKTVDHKPILDLYYSKYSLMQSLSHALRDCVIEGPQVVSGESDLEAEVKVIIRQKAEYVLNAINSCG